LVVGGALLVAVLAQVRIPLGFTPVPITLQTFGVTLVGASLGSRRGMYALVLYVLLGALGFPFYAGGQGGWEHVSGSTGGYLVGFVLAAALVGWMTERRADRRPWTAFLAFQAGSLVIFACGLAGLMMTLGIGLSEALRIGWLPFVPGDLLKTAVAAGLFPAAWLVVDRFSRST
jgi:biotin transport system substrate-specific component